MNEQFINSTNIEGLEMMGPFFGSVIVLISFIAIIGYVISAMGLSSLAKTNGYEDVSFYAWIPLFSIYLIGVLSGEAKTADYDGKQLMTFYLIAAFFTWIPFIGWILTLLAIGAYLVALVDMFKRMDFESPWLSAILSAFIPLVQMVVIFVNRKKEFITK